MRICNVATIYFNSLTVLCLALKSLIQIKTNNWYLSFTENAKNCLTWGTLKRHISIGVLVVYIDTGSTVPNIPSKSRDLADENNIFWRNGNDSKQEYYNKQCQWQLTDYCADDTVGNLEYTNKVIDLVLVIKT
jgi:hypothetical protein